MQKTSFFLVLGVPTFGEGGGGGGDPGGEKIPGFFQKVHLRAHLSFVKCAIDFELHEF